MNAILFFLLRRKLRTLVRGASLSKTTAGKFSKMGRLVFITGATRSGKSRLAVEMAMDISDEKVAFLATCIPKDSEMKRRVLSHKKNRPSRWKTIEAGEDILKALKSIKADFKVVVIDCLTLFVSDLLTRGESEKEIKKKVLDAVEFMSKAPYTSIVVSNEVGAGIVPENRLAREFRDLAGIANQIVAKEANEAYFVVAGIPMKIK